MPQQTSQTRHAGEALRIPKYVQIANDLKAAINSGELAPNDQLPSFSAISRRYTVTQNTIEKALVLLEQEGLVRREHGRGIFVEPPQENKTGYIGLLIRNGGALDLYQLQLINGMQQQAREYGLNLALVDQFRPVTHRQIDGVIICSNHLEVALIELPATMPRVLLPEPAGGIEIANVVADDFGGAKMATRHLLELGHRRISYLLHADYDSYSRQRLAGYRAALEEFDIKFDERLCFYINKRPNSYFLSGEECMNRWLANGWRDLGSTAILGHNDSSAFGIMKALGEAGLKVPEDISVVGFDDLEASRDSEQILTTINVPLHDIGAAGVQLLWEQIQKGVVEPEKRVLPVQLKVGQSTRAI